MRRWGLTHLEELGVPAPLRDLLAASGLPEALGPYFEAADEPLPLADYTRLAELPEPDAASAVLWRLGGDSGSEICVDPEGRVYSVFAALNAPDRLVNSSVEAWLAGIGEFERLLQRLEQAAIGPEAVTAVEEFHQRLDGLDPAAMADPDHWWPLVTDDLRLTASVDAAGIIEFRTAAGALRTVRGYTVPGHGHVERRLWDELETRGIEPEQVTRVHTDLEPCMLPGGYCADWLAVTFPGAEVTYSFGYGPGAAGRADGVRELIAFTEESDR
jgi:hypothetical protein